MKYLYIILSLFFLSSCHGDLDISSKSEISSTSMWKDESDAVSAMYGMHHLLRSGFSSGYMYWGEYRNGLWDKGIVVDQPHLQVFMNEIPTDHSFTNWEGLYSTINSANLLLKYTKNISFADDNKKNWVLANALYVRAFCYYWIARIWGDAPLLLDGFESDSAEDLFPKRTPVDKLYSQVYEDIEQALTFMPDNMVNRNLASREAINMLKLDFSLWMYKFTSEDIYLDNAEKAIEEIKLNPSYSLLPNFKDVFKNELNDEIIFAWTYTKDEYTGGSPSEWLIPLANASEKYLENPIQAGSNQQWCCLSEEYKQFLESVDTDQRTSISFQTFFDDGKNMQLSWINKFVGTWENGTRIFDSDMIVYRYADLILFEAELALIKKDLDRAKKALNKIAFRAYNIENYYDNLSSEKDVLDAIVNERMKEFVAEGKLWWDFIRLGVVFEKNKYLKGREDEKNILLWPISQTSLNKNPNLQQTDGF